MSAEAAPAPQEIPPGHRLLAWDGIGLFIPEGWSIGRHDGDSLFGSIRVDTLDKVAARVRWWHAPKRFHIDAVARQFQSAMVQQAKRKGAGKGFWSLPDLGSPQDKTLVVVPTNKVKLPARLGDQTRAFIAGPAPDSSREPTRITHVLVAAYRRDLRRAAVWQFMVDDKRPAFEEINRLAQGLLIQGLDQWRDWQVLDMAFQVPPGARLDKAVLASGVCYFRFDWKGARLGLRRFSAASAILGRLDAEEAELIRWCRGTYATEFFDMRYQVDSQALDVDRHALVLTGRKRLLAPLELRWVISRHRRLPRRIEIVWDKVQNKICCFEIAKLTDANRAAMRQVIDSYRAVPEEAAPAPALVEKGQPPRSPRDRSLAARIRRSGEVQWQVNERDRVMLQYEHVRPLSLKVLRALASLPTQSRQQKKVELDLIGSMIWQACDGQTRVRDIVEQVRRQFKITYREAEISVTEYVKTLGGRGLILLEMPPK
jgi:hypothetical protein